jgi:DNA-binding FadR family transcriptional regulator
MSTGEVARVADALVGRIVAGAYPAGLRLPPEVALAKELGCSRGTLREALRSLASMGLVSSRRGSGVLVHDFRREGRLALLPAYLAAGQFDHPLPAVAGELLRTRRFLAMEAARLSATYAAPTDLVFARAAQKRLAGLAGDPVAHTLAEMDLFHELLLSSKIWPSVWLANAFWEPLRALHERFAGIIGYVPEGHAAMVESLFARIERRDAAGATKVVGNHFTRVDDVVLPMLDAALVPMKEAVR